MSSLWEDVDDILEKKEPEPETVPIDLAEDKVFDAPFTSPTKPQPEPRGCAKRHRSSRTTEGEDAHARKKERTALRLREEPL